MCWTLRERQRWQLAAAPSRQQNVPRCRASSSREFGRTVALTDLRRSASRRGCRARSRARPRVDGLGHRPAASCKASDASFCSRCCRETSQTSPSRRGSAGGAARGSFSLRLAASWPRGHGAAAAGTVSRDIRAPRATSVRTRNPASQAIRIRGQRRPVAAPGPSRRAGTHRRTQLAPGLLASAAGGPGTPECGGRRKQQERGQRGRSDGVQHHLWRTWPQSRAR